VPGRAPARRPASQPPQQQEQFGERVDVGEVLHHRGVGDLAQRRQVGARAEVAAGAAQRDHAHRGRRPRHRRSACVSAPISSSLSALRLWGRLSVSQATPSATSESTARGCVMRRPAPGAPARRRSSGTSTSSRSIAVESVLPCASVFSDTVPPPPSALCSRKLSASRFGSSKRSTSPWQMPRSALDALDGQLLDEDRVELRAQRDDADVRGVALVAGARVREVDQGDSVAAMARRGPRRGR
jgi:hypothetical protein